MTDQPEGYGQEPTPQQPQGHGGGDQPPSVGHQPTQAWQGQPPYGRQPPPGQPPYGDQPSYGPQPPYGEQPSYGSQPPYGSPPYGAQPPYGPQPPAGGPWGPPGTGGYGPQDPGGPGGWGPPPGPPAKSNSGVIIAVAVAAVLVLLGGGGVVIWALGDKGGDNPTRPVAASAPPTQLTVPPAPTDLPSTFPTPTMPSFPTPSTSSTLDESMFVQPGDCVRITGKSPHLRMLRADCDSAQYKVLKRFSGTSDRAKCRGVSGYTTAFWSTNKKYSFLSYVICLKRE